jgi:hypothetical protein
MSLKNFITTLSLGLALLLALACGGGSSSTDSTDQATLRLAGGKAGDTVKAITLNGTEVGSATFDAAGTASLKVGTSYSLRLYVNVKGKNSEYISLFETLVGRSELKAALSAKKALAVTVNSATTIVTQDISATDLAAIYSAELSGSSTSVTATTSTETTTTSTTLSSNVTEILAFFTPKIWSTTYASSSSASPISTGATASFVFSSSGDLYVDDVKVATSPVVTSAGYEITWTSSTYKYSASLTGQPGSTGRTMNEVNLFSTAGVFYGQYRPATTLAKFREESSSFTDLATLLSSKFGLTSLSTFELTSVASSTSTGISALSKKIKRHAILSGIALRSSDNGSLTSSGWAAVLTASNNIDTATDVLVAAQALSDAIKAYMATSTKVTTADFGTKLLAYLGTDTSIVNILAGLQSGDASGALTFIQSTSTLGSSTDYTALGWTSLANNDVLSAYKYFSAGAANKNASDETLVLAALTRVISMSVKDSDAAIAFRKAMNINYIYKNTASLSSTLDNAELAIEKNTSYGSRKDLQGIASIDEIVSYVKSGFLVDVEASLAELERVSSSVSVSIASTYQGTDHKGVKLATSPLLLDALDVKALRGSLQLAKAKAEYFLSQNLKIEGVNSTSANTLKTIYSAMDEEMFDGQVVMASSGNWIYSSGSNEAFSQLGLLGKTLTLVGGYPGELDLDGLTNLDGSKVRAEISKWNEGEHAWLKYGYYSSFFSGNSYTHVVEFDMTVDSKLLTGVTAENRDYKVHAIAAWALNGESDWVFELKHNYQTSGFNYSYQVTDSVYSAKYNVTSGALSLNTSISAITDDTLVSWLEKNSAFLTVSSTYAGKARDSVKASAQLISSVVDSLQGLDVVTTPRLNNLLESQEDLVHTNGDYVTDSELDGTQVFLKGMVESLYGAANVDPSVFGHGLEKSSLDLSVFFKKNFRDLGLVDGKVLKTTNSSGNVSYDADESELRSDLSGMLVSGNLFGVTLSSVGSSNIEDVFADVGDKVNDWVEGTRVKVTLLEKVTDSMSVSSYTTYGVRADFGGNIFSFSNLGYSSSANVDGELVQPSYGANDSVSGIASLLVIKRDPKNKIIWKKQLPSYSTAYLYAEIDQQSCTYMVSSVSSSIANILFTGVSLNSINSYLQIVKLDSDGGVAWAKLIDGVYVSGFNNYSFSAQGSSFYLMSSFSSSANIYTMGQTSPDTVDWSLLPVASASSKNLTIKINKSTGAIEALSDLGLNSSSMYGTYIEFATSNRIFVETTNGFSASVNIYTDVFSSVGSIGPVVSSSSATTHSTSHSFDKDGNVYYFLRNNDLNSLSYVIYNLSSSISVTLNSGKSLLAKYSSSGALLEYHYYSNHAGYASVNWIEYFAGEILVMGTAYPASSSEAPFKNQYGYTSSSYQFIQALSTKSDAFGEELGYRYFRGDVYPAYSDEKGVRLGGVNSYNSYSSYINGRYVYGSIFNYCFPFDFKKDVVEQTYDMTSRYRLFVSDPVPMDRPSSRYAPVFGTTSSSTSTKPNFGNLEDKFLKPEISQRTNGKWNKGGFKAPFVKN